MKQYIVLFLFIIAALLTACSSSSSHGILTFFFDGVPDSTNQEFATTDIAGDTLTANGQSKVIKKREPQFILHGPYQAKLCGECHNTDQGFKVTKKEPELCYDCHEIFEETSENLHGPVSGGFCMECHDPHKSKNKGLLVAKERDLCFNCHEETELKANDNHPTIEEEACSTCHDPHGNNEEYLLRI